MGKTLAKQTSAAFDRFRNDLNSRWIENPLLVRKKFQMKDVYFRRDLPEREVFRCELAFDTEVYVLLLIGAAVLFFGICRFCSAVSGARERRRIRRNCKN